jgi:predicted nucleotidyltransferase
LKTSKPEGDFSDGGFDYFSRLEELEEKLSSMLGCKVDVIECSAHGRPG